MAVKQVKWILMLVLICSFFFSVLAISSSGRKKSLPAAIHELNRRGPYLGLIAVYATEEDAFFANGSFKPSPKHPYVDLSGRRFRVGTISGTKVIYVKCGVGLVNAATATQQMLDVFDVIGVVHFGIAGNANCTMSIGDVIILKQVAQTGLWDWLKPNVTVPTNDAAELDFGSYNVPRGGDNELGVIGFRSEYFYSKSGKPNVEQRTLWFQTSQDWVEISSSLEGMELQRCVNSSLAFQKCPS